MRLHCSFCIITGIIIFTKLFFQTPESMKTVSISMWYFCVALGNLIVIFINKFVAFEKKVGNQFLFPLIYTHKTEIICLVCFLNQSNMFFMFAFIAFLTIIATCKLSNTYEKLYHKNKTDTENENDRDNVNLGNALSNNTTKNKPLIIKYLYLCVCSDVIKKGKLSTIVLKTKRL